MITSRFGRQLSGKSVVDDEAGDVRASRLQKEMFWALGCARSCQRTLMAPRTSSQRTWRLNSILTFRLLAREGTPMLICLVLSGIRAACSILQAPTEEIHRPCKIHGVQDGKADRGGWRSRISRPFL